MVIPALSELRLAAIVHAAAGIVRSRTSAARRAARGHQERHYRAIWTAAAEAVGLPVRAVSKSDVEIDLPSSSLRVRGTHCSVDGPQVLERAGDKALVARMLADAGIPVPTQQVTALARLDEVRAFLVAAPGPCVVKPARDTAAGRGVTTGVRTGRDLRRAAVAAAAAAARGSALNGGALQRLRKIVRGVGEVPLLIEHQIPGDNYRLLLLDGELVDAIRRDPPTVVADGERTVAALVDTLNGRRLRAGGGHGQVLVARDLDLERTVAGQGLTLRAVPAAGTIVQLKTTINDNAPDANWPARAALCDEIVAQARTAAAVVGARLAGVDVITPDPAQPLEDTGGRVLEVNTTPGLAMHYHGHDGEVDVAAEILRRLAARTEAEPAA